MKSGIFSLILFILFLIVSMMFLFKEDAAYVSFFMGLSIINLIAALYNDLSSKH